MLPALAPTTLPVQPDCERHRLPGDRPAVTAAIASLARTFQLRDLGDGRWELQTSEPVVVGTITVHADDARFSVVELRIAPSAGDGTFDEAIGLVVSLWPAWLIALIFLRVIGTDPLFSLLLVTAIAGASIAPLAGLCALFESSRLRRDRAWIAAWRGSFMTALTARLDVQTPYR